MSRFFYIDPADIADSLAVVRGAEATHIRRTLRLKPGDIISLFDGRGTLYETRIRAFSDRLVQVEVLSSRAATAEPSVEILVAQAFLKEKKMDMLVRQLTELGMSAWLPFISRRSVARPDSRRLESRRLRWEAIAREAVKQCRRGHIPEICQTVSFEGALEKSNGYDGKIIFWEAETDPLRRQDVTIPVAKRASLFVMIGPEGGFDLDEIEAARRAGFHTAAMGPRILRAETAAVAACSLVQYLFGDLGQKIS